MKLGGKTSLLSMELDNWDSVPMIKSGLCSETKWETEFFLENKLRQLIIIN